jgi:dihydroflavonol-4-reductase
LPEKNVFITGAAGFIGAHVTSAFVGSGYKVRALAHGSLASGEVPGGFPVSEAVEWVAGDVCRASELVAQIRGCRFLVHCAALYSFAPWDRAAIGRVNVEGTSAILEAARIAGVERAVVTSSGATVGTSRDGKPATEADTASDEHASTYHRSKVDQERVSLASALPVVLVLPTAPVGPGDRKPTPTGRLIVDFANGKIPARPRTGGLNLVAVEDVGRAHVAALERGKSRERYLVGGENLSFDEVWELLSSVTGRPAPRWRLPFALALGAAYVDELRCRIVPNAIPFVPLEGVRMSREFQYVDSSKAARELDHRPTSVRDALVRAVAWYRERGYIA